MKDKRILIFCLLAIASVGVYTIPKQKEREMIPIENMIYEKEVDWETIEIEEIDLNQEEVFKEYVSNKEIALKPELQVFTQKKCEEYSVSYPLILALMESESTFLPQIGEEQILGGTEGEARYYGYMQLSEGKIREAKTDYGIDAHTPQGNIEMGIILIARYMIKYEKDVELVITAYKAGEGSADMGFRVNCKHLLERMNYFEGVLLCGQE